MGPRLRLVQVGGGGYKGTKGQALELIKLSSC